MATPDTPTDLQMEVLDRRVVFTQTFDAPRQLVWDVFTDPRHIPQFWGPRSLMTTVETMDLRPGGAWRFVQRDADGHQYTFSGEFLEVVPPRRLVQTFVFEGDQRQALVETMVLEEIDGRTRLTATAEYSSNAARDAMIAAGMESGARDLYERLAELVAALRHDERTIVITRLLPAPREHVFDAWFDSGAIGAWWGSDGFTTTVEAMDPRPGGVWRFVMRGPDGVAYPNHVVYRAIERPGRIAYSHGTDAEHPAEFEATVSLEAVDAASTRITLEMRFRGRAERDQRVAFGAVAGGAQTLARLAAYLGTPGRATNPAGAQR